MLYQQFNAKFNQFACGQCCYWLKKATYSEKFRQYLASKYHIKTVRGKNFNISGNYHLFSVSNSFIFVMLIYFSIFFVVFVFNFQHVQDILNTSSDGSTSKLDQTSNESIHSNDSSGIRDVNETDSAKLSTSQALSLTLSLPNQSELLPIAEEKDSPGGSSKAEPEIGIRKT